MEIIVLGAGSWGATLATLLLENRNNVILWEFDFVRTKKLQDRKIKPFETVNDLMTRGSRHE